MAASTTRPTRASIALTLVAAAVIGFLLGALLATTTTTGDTVAASPAAPAPASSPSAPATPAPTPAPTSSPAPSAPVDADVTLTADRDRAETDELIRLEGVLRPITEDAELQVQQSVDGIGFVDFPVTATTRSDGSFGIWVKTGRVGTNEFRMVADVEGTEVVSNAVQVEIFPA